eukprot:Gb_37497 [translate_table: standard]
MNMNLKMSKVNIKSKPMEVMKASVPTPEHLRHCHLSNWDQVFRIFSHMGSLHFYEYIKDENDVDDKDPMFMSTHTQKISLAKALRYFYPIANRFREIGRDWMLHIECNDQGVEFHEAQIEGSLRSVLDF